MGLVPEHLKRSPNAKMFLRSFWFRAALKEVVHADEMHIYTLARCAAALRRHDSPGASVVSAPGLLGRRACQGAGPGYMARTVCLMTG